MEPLNSQTPRILIVDDNQAIHGDFRKILCPASPTAGDLAAAEAALFNQAATAETRTEFDLVSAFQGKEALELVRDAIARQTPYAMAFLDVRMPPGWDGVETATEIWKVDPDIQIVICTAYSDYSWSELHHKLAQPDRLVILKKPFDNIEVLQLAHSLCEKWRLLRENRAQMFDLERKVIERTTELQETNRRLELEIAERKQTENALRESQQMVLRQERLAAVGQLSAGVAHDFNNIMTIIQGHAGLLLASPVVDAAMENSLHAIAGASTRAAKLTQQLLAFSRKQVMISRALDLDEVTKNFAGMLRHALDERTVLSLKPSRDLPLMHGDPAMIEQVLMNLVVNARDAMPNGGELEIATQSVTIAQPELHDAEMRSGKFVCVSVRDTGCGMDVATLKRIFEPFFTTKDVGQGTGLGLATVYGIVKQHHGWLDVESTPGKGTTFRIHFPVTTEPIKLPEPALTPASLSAARANNETILVVEDEASVRVLVRNIFQRSGYRVLEASSGDKALDLIECTQQHIDLLLTDLVMPGELSGRELAQKLQARNPSLKVILTSGYSQDFSSHEFLREGFHFLPKPYSPSALLQMVRSSIDARRSDVAA